MPPRNKRKAVPSQESRQVSEGLHKQQKVAQVKSNAEGASTLLACDEPGFGELGCDEPIPEDGFVPVIQSEGLVDYIYHPEDLLRNNVVGAAIDDSSMIQWMLEREAHYRPRIDYISESKVSPVMRAKLIDWVQNVSDSMRLKRETTHLAVNYIDRYISSKNPPENATLLQLMAIVSLFIAAKSEEVKLPDVQAFLYQTAVEHSRNRVFVMETEILAALEWFLLPTTAWSWVKIYVCKTVHIIDELRKSESLSVELCRLLEDVVRAEKIFQLMELIDLAILHPSYIKFPPSHIASAAFVLFFPVNNLFSQITHHALSDIEECKSWLNELPSTKSRFHVFRAENHRLSVDAMIHQQPHSPDAINLLLAMLR